MLPVSPAVCARQRPWRGWNSVRSHLLRQVRGSSWLAIRSTQASVPHKCRQRRQHSSLCLHEERGRNNMASRVEQEISCLLDWNFVPIFLPGEAGAKSDRQVRGTPIHRADTDGVLIPAVKLDMQVVGANAPTVVADRELSLDLGRFQFGIPSLMPDVAGQSTGGSQVRKKPTSPGMPSGKLMIIALSP